MWSLSGDKQPSYKHFPAVGVFSLKFTLCIWRTLCRHVTIGTPMVIFAVLTVTVLPRLYQQCTNCVKSSQKQSKDSQDSKNHHWCTNRHMSTKYQDCTNSVPIVKNSQKTVKTVKMTIGVPIVTCLPRLHQQCTNSVPIVKNSQKTVKTVKMRG